MILSTQLINGALDQNGQSPSAQCERGADNNVREVSFCRVEFFLVALCSKEFKSGKYDKERDDWQRNATRGAQQSFVKHEQLRQPEA